MNNLSLSTGRSVTSPPDNRMKTVPIVGHLLNLSACSLLLCGSSLFQIIGQGASVEGKVGVITESDQADFRFLQGPHFIKSRDDCDHR